MRLDDRADVCLILEGTYPYVMGGVSAWVHHLVTQMPEIRFGIVHISPSRDFYGTGLAYEVPENVVYVDELPLMCDGSRRRRGRRRTGSARAVWRSLERLRCRQTDALSDLVTALRGRSRPLPEDLLASRESWEALLDLYRREAPDESFIDAFWTWRFAYEPLLNVLLHEPPRAGMYHTVSTGYAGAFAGFAAQRWQRPMILTEHGIYTKERRIEIYSASWIRDWDPGEYLIESRAPYFRQFWSRHFETMSRICYENADRIYTLYGGNRDAQVGDGADPDKIEIIPNGVDVEGMTRELVGSATEDSGARPFTIAFVGRVTPIKDVRTFMSAMRLVARVVPDVRVRVLGPTDEAPEYARKCEAFARELGLQDNVSFEGRVAVREELPGTDVLVLTSISEAQPLVVLEAGAMGIPVVATDVGSCRELLEGRTPEDRSLGVGGLVTPIASPGATARAVLELYCDPDLRERMGASLQQRVRQFYDQRDMVAAYRSIYEQHFAPEVC